MYDSLDKTGLKAVLEAIKAKIPASLPANGGNADIARQVISPSSKANLYENEEGGNLELVAPDGVHLMQMDLYNNESFRMYFYDGSKLYFPVDFNFSTGKLNIHGDADTVGGKVPEKIFYDNGFAADLNGATQSGCYATSPDTLNVPFSAWWLVDTTNYNNQFIVQKAHTIGNTVNTVSYIRNYANNAWSDWKEISTTPIKKISFPSVGTNASGGGTLFSADFGTPITIACTSRADTQCTPFFAANQWLVLAKDCVTLDPIPAGTYSFDVWYI